MSGIIDHRSYNYSHGIVCRDCLAKEYSEAGFKIQMVYSGTFVQVHSIREDDVLFCIVRDDMEVEMKQMVCKKADIISVPENLWGPLFAVKKVARLSLVRDSKVAESIGNISVGHSVQVLGPDSTAICIANVTFKNSIGRLGVGVYFGLKVVSSKENLQTIVEKVSLLGPGTKGFPRGCDIVVTVDKILPSNCNYNKEKSICYYDKEFKKQLVKDFNSGDEVNSGNFKSVITYNLKDKQSNSVRKDEGEERPSFETYFNHSQQNKTINSENSLQVGDKVIYLNGDIPEKGLVKWIGPIDKSLKVEVEFENPVASGAGDGLGEFFPAKYQNPLILPPAALIKFSDYVMSTTKRKSILKKIICTSFHNNNNNNNNNYSNLNTNNNLKTNISFNNNINNNNNNHNSNISSSGSGGGGGGSTSGGGGGGSTSGSGSTSSSSSSSTSSSSSSSNINNDEDCCRFYEFTHDTNQDAKDSYKKLKKGSVSHPCLKNSERNFEADGFLVANNEVIFGGKDLFEGVTKSGGKLEFGLQSVSESFLKRSNNSVGNGLTQNETNLHLNIQNPIHSHPLNRSGHDLYYLAGSDRDKSHCSLYCTGKNLQKSPVADDDFNFYELCGVHSAEKNLKIAYEKDTWCPEYSNNDENPVHYCGSSKLSQSSVCSHEDLGKGSVVELSYKGEPHYGVIRWIGTLPDDREDCCPRLIAGIEMEEEYPNFTDGTFNNKRYFQCNPKKALFVPLSECRKDSRFSDECHKHSSPPKINYGQIDCPVVEGIIPPINRKGDIESICGKNRGIQGHHNSCYLDATLFSMFAFTSVFDSLLYRPPTKSDIPQYSEVQRVLREEIVNPLRKNLYVRADRVMKLRTLLERLSSVSGLTCEEKDPEEFLNSLLAQILKAEPFLKLSSGQEAFHYQLFVEKDERLVLPSVQQLLEQSFLASDIKLSQVPSCLIIQMPRFGKSFKMYSKILPPQLLDITDIIENSPRQCTVCGKLAEYECKDCFGQEGLESISFCKVCLDTVHNHCCRSSHNSRALTVPVEFCELQEHCVIPRLYMELFAVVCIETSHYVAFVKCGSGSDAPWCFFDSMADRKGEQNGYNIPEMVPCPDLPFWLSEDGAKMLNEMRDERQLTEHAKRLFSDAYMCMYQSPDLMMYR